MSTPDLGLLERMPIGLGIYDLDGALVHANAHFGSIVSCGTLPSQDKSKPARWQGFAANGAELAVSNYPCERALKGEDVSPGVDLLHFGPDEEGRWLKVSAAPIVDPHHHGIVGVVLLFLEREDRAPDSAFAARANQRFRQFAENSRAAIWIVDAATGTFSYRNPLHLSLFGPDDDRIGGLPDWLDQVADPDRAMVLDCYDRAMHGETKRIEYRLQHCGNVPSRRVQETVFPITGDNGETGMIGGMAVLTEEPVGTILYTVGSVPTASIRRPEKVKGFASLAELLDIGSFLASGCVIIDAATTPDFETHLARTLACHARALPIIIIGDAGTPAAAAIAAMRAGAADYLLRPLAETAVNEAFLNASTRLGRPERATAAPQVDPPARLSPREREVLVGLVRGGTNKSIGRELGISPRTVELHRSHLMERMNVRTLAGLLQAAHGMRL